MKLTTAILAVGMMTAELWAQNPNVIQNVQSTMNTVQQQKTDSSNAALGIKGAPAASQSSKPAAGAPAKSASPAAAAAAKTSSAPVSASTKSVPAPASAKATPAPTTAKTQAAPAAGKASAPKSAIAVKVASAHAAPKQAVATTAKAAASAKPSEKISAKASGKKNGKTVISAAPKAPAPKAKTAELAKTAEAPKPPKPEEKKWAMNGKRDPFFSPVVQQPTGSGCSTGKKCLEIGQINLHGVVKSDSGFIAVVTNNLGKAYFLRENDPVFNGYVVRITGDSVVFQETYQDQLGKPLTREVVKRIFTPAV
jgi:Tfp pilus assembly protein PilP